MLFDIDCVVFGVGGTDSSLLWSFEEEFSLLIAAGVVSWLSAVSADMAELLAVVAL